MQVQGYEKVAIGYMLQTEQDTFIVTMEHYLYEWSINRWSWVTFQGHFTVPLQVVSW